MQISIAERLKPFCHLPGTSTILPGSSFAVQIFPCLIRIYQFEKVAELNLKGPVRQFTICNDLEKGRITVSGMTVDGWIRYHLISSKKGIGIRLLVDRVPLGGCRIILEKGESIVLLDKEWLDIILERAVGVMPPASSFEPFHVPPIDRLSLGSNKAQDWEMIRRRLSLKEILPHWHRLGQLITSPSAAVVCEGTLSLLEECRHLFASGKPDEAEKSWLKLFLGGFSSLLVPQLEDRSYQGLFSHPTAVSRLNVSPLVILSEGARLIRQLFVQQEDRKISILPFLFPSLPCGRLLDVLLPGIGLLSLEWTKKTIRRLILFSEQEQELALKFRSNVRSYRLYEHSKDKGYRKLCSSSLIVKKNCHYFFDNFN